MRRARPAGSAEFKIGPDSRTLAATLSSSPYSLRRACPIPSIGSRPTQPTPSGPRSRRCGWHRWARLSTTTILILSGNIEAIGPSRPCAAARDETTNFVLNSCCRFVHARPVSTRWSQARPTPRRIRCASSASFSLPASRTSEPEQRTGPGVRGARRSATPALNAPSIFRRGRCHHRSHAGRGSSGVPAGGDTPDVSIRSTTTWAPRQMPPENLPLRHDECTRRLRSPHLFYLDDAKECCARADVIAHRFLDRDVDEEFLALMKSRQPPTPTLTREVSTSLRIDALVLRHQVFLKEGPRRHRPVARPARQAAMRASTRRSAKAVSKSQRNLKRDRRGILVAMGTDRDLSRRFRILEHVEMAMMSTPPDAAQVRAPPRHAARAMPFRGRERSRRLWGTCSC